MSAPVRSRVRPGKSNQLHAEVDAAVAAAAGVADENCDPATVM